MVPSLIIFQESKDDSHLNFGVKGTLKVIRHPSEQLTKSRLLMATCSHTLPLLRVPARGDLLPPHPQVTPRCGPFLHRELKDEREVLEGIELSILGLTVERAELSQVVTPSERK